MIESDFQNQFVFSVPREKELLIFQNGNFILITLKNEGYRHSIINECRNNLLVAGKQSEYLQLIYKTVSSFINLLSNISSVTKQKQRHTAKVVGYLPKILTKFKTESVYSSQFLCSDWFTRGTHYVYMYHMWVFSVSLRICRSKTSIIFLHLF